MKTIAIITEYNPMHLGHLYQIEYVKNKFGDDCRIILVMSGNFVQRGEPALYSKYERAEDAVKSGASMVIELPVSFASASAKEFANAAVKLISSLGVVDTIVAGAEDAELISSNKFFDKVNEILHDEPADFQEILRSYLDKGKNFAEARSLSLADLLGKDHYANDGSLNLDKDVIQNLLKKSNNILALEYSLAIKAENTIRKSQGSRQLKLHLSPRKGADENSLETVDDFSLSASAIRNILLETNTDDHRKSVRFLKFENYLNPVVLSRVIEPKYRQYDSYVQTFLARVLTTSVDELISYRDFSTDLANRIKNISETYLFSASQTNAESNEIFRDNLFQEISNKYFVETRVKRAALSLLLGIKENDWQDIKSDGPAFINVLAVDKNGRYLMKLMRKLSTLPITVKNSDLLERLNNDLKTSKIQQQLNLNADALYKLFCQKEDEGIYKEYIYIK